MNTQVNNQLTGADAFGRAVTARLTEGAQDMPRDITERLKAARAQAVAKRRVASVQVVAHEVSISGGQAALQFGDADGGWWNRIGSLLPLLALVAGLIFIAVLQDDMRAREVADVDSELLIDELPPAAYTDPGFTQYLRASLSN
jgi:hypothetical protein